MRVVDDRVRVRAVDVHARGRQLVQHPRGVAAALPGREVVAAHLRVGLDEHLRVQRADQLVRLQQALVALLARLAPLLHPAGEDLHLLIGRDVLRRVHRQVVVVDLLAVVLARPLLVGHAGRAVQQRRDAVAVDRGEQVVDVVVLVGDRLVVEHPLQHRTDVVLDEVDRELRDLVVDGVLVGREEVPVGLLVGVDHEHARVLHDRRREAVVLHVHARAAVAVGVKAPRRGALVEVTAIRVGGRDDERRQVVQTARVGAVQPRRHLVEQAHRRLAGRRLVAVRRGGDPREGRPVAHGRQPFVGREVALAHVGPELRVVAARVEVVDVVGRADDRVDDLAAERRVGHLLLDHPHARVVLRRDRDGVLVGLQVGRQPARRRAGGAAAERQAEHAVVRRDRRVVLQVLGAPCGVGVGLGHARRRHERRGDQQERGSTTAADHENLRLALTAARTLLPENRADTLSFAFERLEIRFVKLQ